MSLSPKMIWMLLAMGLIGLQIIAYALGINGRIESMTTTLIGIIIGIVTKTAYDKSRSEK
jgi:uncharacterized membrane protein